MSMTNDIAAFHQKFCLEYNGPPRSLPEDVFEFRRKFMQEELNEYVDCMMHGDLVGQLDALVDLVYVALGTAYLQGLPFDEGWKIVQACNLKKVRAAADGSNSKRGSPNDVVKPSGWVGPEVALNNLLVETQKAFLRKKV